MPITASQSVQHSASVFRAAGAAKPIKNPTYSKKEDIVIIGKTGRRVQRGAGVMPTDIQKLWIPYD